MKMTIYALIGFLIWFMSVSHATEKERSIPCDDKRPMVVRVAPGRVTVLNFPFKPKDVVIMAVKPSSHTNAVVYLEERRCIFDLIAVSSRADDILIVKDPKDSQYEVKFHE